MSIAVAFERFSRLVDWFIPASMAADRTMRKQARMFLVSHICGPFIGNSVPLAIYLLDAHPGKQNAILTISITGFWIFPVLLKYFKHYNMLAIFSIQNLMFCIIWSCLMLGGIQSPTVPWVLTIPLLSFFYLGSSPDIRLLVLFMFTANFAAFWFISGAHLVEPSHIAAVAAEPLGLVSTIAAALYIAMMALYYAKALASHTELEAGIREHRATAFDLRRAAAAAAQADAVKTAFLARITSELRLPLYAVIGYSSILMEDGEQDSDTVSHHQLRTIHTSGLELLRFANDVLDLSKIESDRMEIFDDVFNPADLLRDVLNELGPAAAAHRNRLILDVDPALGAVVSDMRKIRIVLFQLISNAVKFTSDGIIGIDARLEAAGPTTPASLVISVTDSGVGIATNRMANLFDQFAVNDDAGASKYGGSGLGLALSRRLCRLLGGDIDVETKLGVGSRFTMTVPTGSAAVALDPENKVRASDRGRAAPSPLDLRPIRDGAPIRNVA